MLLTRQEEGHRLDCPPGKVGDELFPITVARYIKEIKVITDPVLLIFMEPKSSTGYNRKRYKWI